MLNYRTKIEKTAKSTDEAKALILEELGLDESEVSFEVKDEGTKGFLGLGSKDAVVSATVLEPASYKAKVFLKKIFDQMNLEVNIETRLEDDCLYIDLSGEFMGIIIGKRGDTLDSLQYLTSLVVNRDKENYIKITINTENYREKRNDALVALAERLAAKVTKSGKKYTLEPMNPYERRIIHSSLQSSTSVTTFSVGEDPYRKVVIAPKNPPKTYHKRSSYYSSSASQSLPREKKHSNFESYAESHSEGMDFSSDEE